MPSDNGKPQGSKGIKHLRTLGLLGTIPLLIGLGPLIGYFAGSWLDKKLGVAPYLTIILLILGFGASIKETVRIIKIAGKESDE